MVAFGRALGCVAAAVCATLFVPRAARACGPFFPVAQPSYAAPRAGAVVPANLPGIFVAAGHVNYVPCAISLVELLDDQAQPVALAPSTTEPGASLLAQTLEEGKSYTLSYSESCSSGGAPAVHSQTISAGTARSLPTSIGHLQITDQGVGTLGWYADGCSWSTTGGWVRVRLVPSCELVPFLDVTQFIAEVDGKQWVPTQVGSTASAWSTVSKTADLIVADCSAAAPSSGQHIASIRAHIAGAAFDPPPLSVAMPGCDAGAGQNPGAQDAGLLAPIAPCFDPDASLPDAEAGANDASIDAGVGTDAEAGLDAEPHDVGSAGAGGSVATEADASPDAATKPGSDGEADNGNCACATKSRSRRRRAPLGFLLALACAASRRRRAPAST